eukprot:960355-Alexandrium_andersonii.AAC.1
MRAAISGATQRKGPHDRLTGPFGTYGATAGPLPPNCTLKCGLNCALSRVPRCAAFLPKRRP